MQARSIRRREAIRERFKEAPSSSESLSDTSEVVSEIENDQESVYRKPVSTCASNDNIF